MSIIGRNNVLSFHIFDVSKHIRDPEFEKIADLFEQSEKNLCIHNEKKIMNLYDHYRREMGFNCDYVYYLKKEQKSKSTFSKKREVVERIREEEEEEEEVEVEKEEPPDTPSSPSQPKPPSSPSPKPYQQGKEKGEVEVEEEKEEIKEEIIAFAFIEKTNDQNIYTVKILCSHKEKYQYQNEKPGIFLLNKIYHDFVSNKKGVLCIQPATKDLIPYYTKWRTPSYSPFDSEGVSTRGYLLYFEDIDNITDEMLYELVYELSSLRLIKEHISSLDKESSREYLKQQIDAIEDDYLKQQLKDRLDPIKYLTIGEYRDHIGKFKDNIPHEIKGGKRKSRKKKKSLKRKYHTARKSHKRRC